MDFDRFIAAQDPIWDQVLAELAQGRKRTHWMWFVFPQLAGLGRSARARYFGLEDLAAARAYLLHPLLGARLRTALQAVMDSPVADPADIFGSVDALKFRSCLTLFQHAGENPALFEQALDLFYGGQTDPETIRILKSQGRSI